MPTPKKAARLFEIIAQLRDGQVHRAEKLAEICAVSSRTIYRDIEKLKAAGLPIQGSRGSGYQMTAPVTLPPLNLSLAELEALHLGLAVMTEASDPELRASARTLARKIDAALPEDGGTDGQHWAPATMAFADMAAGVQHIPPIRDAVRQRMKLILAVRSNSGDDYKMTVHPLKLEYWGRVWTITVWSEPDAAPLIMRADEITQVITTNESFGATQDIGE